MEWRKDQQQLYGQAYQHQANSASCQQETVYAIVCLGTVTARDRKVLENLTDTNKLLTTELATSNKKLVTAILKITKITEQLSLLKNGKGKLNLTFQNCIIAISTNIG